jgi:cellulose synthase/poly-beta-1,6-N-acetylglucosamine synthase-like glycosyltransferase
MRAVLYTVCTIVHPAFLPMLKGHLESIEVAQRATQLEIPIKLLLSYCKTPSDHEAFTDVIKDFPTLKIESFVHKERLTCAEARNYLFSQVNTDWCVFFDADVLLQSDYFKELNKALASLNDNPKVKAIAGGMGAWGLSAWGYNEYLMDMYAYYGKIENINIKDLDLNTLVVTPDLPINSFSILNLRKTYYLQGYNQIIHKTMYTEHGGYDNSYFGAEDREMAARIYSLGFEIRLVPYAMVCHYFDFSKQDVARRKYGHGYYSAKFRDKYRDLHILHYERGFKKWFKYFLTLVKPPKTFRSWNSYKYYQFAFWTYFFGSFIYNLEKITGYQLFSVFELGSKTHKKRVSTLLRSFNYSNYDFTKQPNH